MKDKTYTTREVATLLGVTVQTVQRWVDAGHLHAWRTAGGHRRLAVDSVDAFVKHSRLQLSGEVQASARTAQTSDRTVTAGAPQGPAILIVDDDEGDREIALRIIQSMFPNAQCFEADNGFSGLIQLGRHKVDILLTDITMPHLDGIQMLRTVRSDPSLSQVTVAAMSSYSRDEIAKRGGLPEGVSFFPKPLQKALVHSFLKQHTPEGKR